MICTIKKKANPVKSQPLMEGFDESPLTRRVGAEQVWYKKRASNAHSPHGRSTGAESRQRGRDRAQPNNRMNLTFSQQMFLL